MMTGNDDDHPTTTTTTIIVDHPQPAIASAAVSEEEGRTGDHSRSHRSNDNEASRKYRRTVYDHSDWSIHRKSYLLNDVHILFDGVIMNQIKREVLLTVVIAIAVCAWNALVGGYQDIHGNMHDSVILPPPVVEYDEVGGRVAVEQWRWWCQYAHKIGIPMEAFALVSPSLGLLLGECPRD